MAGASGGRFLGGNLRFLIGGAAILALLVGAAVKQIRFRLFAPEVDAVITEVADGCEIRPSSAQPTHYTDCAEPQRIVQGQYHFHVERSRIAAYSYVSPADHRPHSGRIYLTEEEFRAQTFRVGMHIQVLADSRDPSRSEYRSSL